MYHFVEEKIKEAVNNGEFNHLPGKGKPLDLKDDLQGLSPEIRRAFKILKHAGYISEEQEKKKELLTFHDLYSTVAGNTPRRNDLHDRKKFDAFVRERGLRRNSNFRNYAKNIYKRLF
ncbi:DUF1992 domain-containing protein [Oceanobacillus senegalensis]|uniref:DnaJ family domain-containing protein n=1 Tax=Oceanobacillus senegalensis TaxID=1936063 RepID=UPI000A312701|nr:DUF1992 domain-containing protein [Oceanobacillus senegalensis]